MKAKAYKALDKLFDAKRKALNKKFDEFEKAFEKKLEAVDAAEEKARAKLEKQCLKEHGKHKFDQNGYCTRCGTDQSVPRDYGYDQEVEIGPWG